MKIALNKNRLFDILTILIVIVGVNLIALKLFTRFDFTEGSIYTLSESSKKIAKNLTNEIKIKFFISNNLPAQFVKKRQNIEDYLDEYVALSNGQITIEKFNPLKNEKAKELANMLRIPPLQFNVIEKDQQQTVKGYLGMAIVKEKTDYEETEDANPIEKFEKYETIPMLLDSVSFEYDFSSALKKVSSLEEKTIGFLNGHEEHLLSPKQRNPFVAQNPKADYPLRSALEKHYQVRSINLSEKNSNLDGIDTLIIAGPRTEISDDEATQIKKFIKEGGNAIFLIDKIDIAQGMIAQKIEKNFANLLDEWGLKIGSALIEDATHAQAAFSKGFFSFVLPYPFWVKVRNLNTENAITSQVESFVLPWTSPLQISKKEGVNVEILAETSSKFEVIPTEITVEVPKEGGEEGETETKITPQQINLDPEQEFNISKKSKDALPLAVIAEKEGEGKIFVIGDSDFLTESFVGRFPSNLVFFLNVVDAFTLGDELISIRSKGVTDRPIKDLTETEKNLIRWFNIIFMPILIIGYGLMRKSMRNAKKKLLF